MTNVLSKIDESHLDRLVVLARTDRSAFGKLYDQIYSPVFRYCIRRTGNRSLAEDSTSSVFLSVARALPSFAGDTWCDFRRWVFTITTNEISALHRKSSRREALLSEAARSGILTGVTDKRPDDIEDKLQTVQSVLHKLTEREQTIIGLRYFSDLPYDDIGQIVGISAGAVRTAAKRAIDKMKQEVER